MPSPNHIRRWIAIGAIVSLGFWGLAFCELIEQVFFENERQMMQHPFWSKVVLGFAAVFMLGGALVPIQVLIFERRERANRPLLPMALGDAVGLPFGQYNGEAEVPNWIRIPVLTLLFVLAAILFLGLLLGLFVGLLTLIL